MNLILSYVAWRVTFDIFCINGNIFSSPFNYRKNVGVKVQVKGNSSLLYDLTYSYLSDFELQSPGENSV